MSRMTPGTSEGARRTGGIEIFAETGMRNLQELRWVLLGSAGMKLPPPAKKTTDLEGKADQRGSSESHPGAGRTPSTKLLNAINSTPKLSDGTVEASRIGLCAKCFLSFSCRTGWWLSRKWRGGFQTQIDELKGTNRNTAYHAGEDPGTDRGP
jgi:hypothetical protein